MTPAPSIAPPFSPLFAVFLDPAEIPRMARQAASVAVPVFRVETVKPANVDPRLDELLEEVTLELVWAGAPVVCYRPVQRPITVYVPRGYLGEGSVVHQNLAAVIEDTFTTTYYLLVLTG